MIVHYTLTLDDYREARAAAGHGVRWLTYGALAWIGLTVLIIGIAANLPAVTPLGRLAIMALPMGSFASAFLAIRAMQQWQLRSRRDILPRTQAMLLTFFVLSLLLGITLALGRREALLGEASLFGTLWWALPLFFILVIGLRMVASSGGINDIWKGLEDQHRPKELELLSDGVTVRDGVSTYQVRWQGLRSAAESDNLFILMPNRYSLLMVPKRAFASDEDRERFRAALRSITPPTGGFPINLPEAKLQK